MEDKKEVSEYRSIFKATSLFGGVQAYTIILGIIRTKIVAVLIGTLGMGMLGLFQEAINLVQSFTSLGLSLSSVKDVSEANATGDDNKVGYTVSVLRKLIWYTGTLGLAVVIILSPLLSKTSFGNYDYTLPFILLSSILLLNQISAGQKVVLQGLRRLRDLAKASALGATFGLLFSIPLYYWLGVEGVVPTLILHAIVSLLLTWYFAKRVKIKKIKVTRHEAFQQGRSMMKMGLALTVSSTLAFACSYFLRWFIRVEGGIEQVGLYVAGFSLMVSYVGMVFSAMSTDYYPRLSAVNYDNKRCCEIINQQADIAILIVAPLMVGMTIFSNFIVHLLYTEEFLGVTYYLIFASVGVLFKAMSWSISYIFLAKSESKIFTCLEIVANVYILGMNIIGYKYFGILGLGVSFSISYALYALQVFLIAKRKYSFQFSSKYIRMFVTQLIMLIISIVVFLKTNGLLFYVLGCTILVFSSLISLKGLDKRLNLGDKIKIKKQ